MTHEGREVGHVKSQQKHLRHSSLVTRHPVQVDGERLGVEDVVAVAREGARAELAPGAIAAMERSRALVERIVARGDTVYGINTGFGDLSRVKIAPDQLAQLQRNLVRSHAAGVGED